MRCWSGPVLAVPAWPQRGRKNVNDADLSATGDPATLFQQVGTPGRIARPFLRRKHMKIFGKTAALALFISFGVAGAALAQSASGGSMSSGSTSNGSMSNGAMASGSMSSGAMSDHAKMKGKKKAKDAMTNGSMSNGSMSSGSMSNGSMTAPGH